MEYVYESHAAVTVIGTRMCNGVGLEKAREHYTLLRHGYSTELQALYSPKHTLSHMRPLYVSVVLAFYLK